MHAQETDVLVVGAGIVGLAHAYAAAKAGQKVVVVEKDMQALGASVRNFGLIWPIGQAPGTALNLALKSKRVWMQLAKEAGFWIKNNGAFILAYHEDEMNVLAEFHESAYQYGYNCKLQSAQKAKDKLGNYVPNHLSGALCSDTEMVVNPAEAIPAIVRLLIAKYKVNFFYGKAVSRIEMPYILAGKYMWKTKKTFICNGDEFSILYPEVFAKENMLKCKLQMMKGKPSYTLPENFPTLSGGLTLLHYASFKHCMSLQTLTERFEKEASEAVAKGIHVLLASNKYGDLIIGDSHTYSNILTPFIDEDINREILKQLSKIYHLTDVEITTRWIGVYAKCFGKLLFKEEVERDVTIITGLGGNGMTLSWALAEENIREAF